MRPAHILAAVLSLLVLSGCAGSPAALGITGPNGAGRGIVPGAPLDGDDAAIPAPGNPRDFGLDYSPSFAPTFGPDGRFYGYN
ncbi:MAG: hypothetical protein JOZ42_05750 [Acetobacteraceae bacterium]|nr:hypothetical protein [Acetobacteraceae bacterium]